METRRILAVLLAACAVLAGCGGAPTTPTDASTTDGRTPSPPPTTESTETTAVPTDQNLALDAETLAADHADALAATSYESRFSFSVDLPDGTAGIAERRTVDRGADLATEVQTTTLDDTNGTTTVDISRVTFVGNDTTYERLTGTNYATVFSTNDGQGTDTSPIDANDVGSDVVDAAASVEWTAVGTATVDGVEVTRYEAAGPESVRQFRDETSFGESAMNRVETTESANATLLVGDDGVVRQFSLTVEGTTDGEPVAVSLDVRFSNVGTASAELPSWLDDAKQNT
ncbi:hypothetical protein ACFPYI_00480 [Halomarina salina]|uniref:LppX_LprAFG lipoprotein n=1 Tax=Halomarina salina TaxID=1872699 RepID=A0ABD5RH76_9EURY|nr:hypothetical protein [Halomarina salina]